MTVKSRIKTAIEYNCVAQGPDDETLILGGKGPDGLCVDIVDRTGAKVKTLVDNGTLDRLKYLRELCVSNGHVIIPDTSNHCVYMVEVTTGRLVDTLTHPNMKNPSKVVADAHGNLYLASRDGQCVLVRTPDGQWRKTSPWT